MNENQIIDLVRQAIWVVIKIAGPPMVAAMVVGIAIAVFQALTQIQEQSLTFVPKILVIFLAVLFLAPFMVETLQGFTITLADQIVAIQ